MILALELPDCSGFRVLVDLVEVASRPSIAVLMLTNNLQQRLHKIAMQNGAYACFVKPFTSCEDVDRAIQRAMAFVGRLPKEDRSFQSFRVSPDAANTSPVDYDPYSKGPAPFGTTPTPAIPARVERGAEAG